MLKGNEKWVLMASVDGKARADSKAKKAKMRGWLTQARGKRKRPK